MNTQYKDKYLKYRNKYLTLKNQIGGNKFRSIPNNGSEHPGLNLQCMWISIRDYLIYHRGERGITAAALKRRVGLSQTTDNIEYNDNNQTLTAGLLRLARELNISLCFLVTNSNGTIANISLDDRGNMLPTRVINGGTGNNVYIAAFGGHFELIIQGPNYVLEKHINAAVAGSEYKPKVPIKNIYKNESELIDENEKNIAKNLIKLIESKQNSDFFRNEITRLENEIRENQNGIKTIKEIGLTKQEEESISAGYLNVIRFNTEQIRIIRTQLRNLEDNMGDIEAMLNSLYIN